MNRRTFLRCASSVAGATAVSSPFGALLARSAAAPSTVSSVGYGPLQAVADLTTGLPLLELPAGFSYRTFGFTGQPMDDGVPTPRAHDGMAAFPAGRDLVRLVRNHEIAGDSGAFAPTLAFDPAAPGGTTDVWFDTARGVVVRTRASLSGTLNNCAGGPTPWGTWITCEEAVAGPDDGKLEQDHGFIFEVSAGEPARREPIRAAGRFVHEAIAIDPATGIVYETEDRQTAGFYRYIPRTPGTLADGGRLQMLAIVGRDGFDTRTGQTRDVTYDARWVDIAEPERPHHDDEARDQVGVYRQGLALGGATFGRLEGAWFGSGRIFFSATNGGEAKLGQVWEYDCAASRLRLVYESPSKDLLVAPDNLCVTPGGGLVVCEDTSPTNCVRGLTIDGQIFTLARNIAEFAGEPFGLTGDYRSSEFAGATFNPDGRWLFVNMQRPGLTVAITGPWSKGGL